MAPIKRVRNPWAPETVQQLVYAIVVSYPIWREAVGWLKEWMKLRAAREIKIKVGPNELIVKGHMGSDELEKLFREFQRQVQESKTGQLKVSLEKGVNRRFPRELTTKSRRRKQ